LEKRLHYDIARYLAAAYGDLSGGALINGSIGGIRSSLYLVCAVLDVTLWRCIHISKL